MNEVALPSVLCYDLRHKGEGEKGQLCCRFSLSTPSKTSVIVPHEYVVFPTTGVFRRDAVA